jgi:hypothetical protein
MDPCVPGTDIKNARSYLHVKMGIPRSLVQGASREAICLALKRCKRPNGMAMPPMGYDRVGKHRIYYSNPRGIDLRGRDYKDLLVGKPSFKVLKRIADKLGLVSDDKDMLKGLIIKRLKTAGAPEPLMVPIKKIRRNSANTCRPLPATINGLKNRANTLLQKPPSMVIAKNLSKNITSPQVRRNVVPIQKSFNRAVAAEQRLQRAVQKPGVTREELANTIKKVQQTQVPLALKPLNQLRLARMRNMQRTAAPAPAPVPQSRLASLAKKQENIVNIEKALRIRANKNASDGNKNAIKPLSNMEQGQLRVIQRRAREAEAAAERAQIAAEAAQERAESANNMREMAKAAAEATEKSKRAIMAIKSMIGAQSEANDVALLKAMKISDANNTKRENLEKLFMNVNTNYLNKIINKYESTGAETVQNNAMRNLRKGMRVGPDQNIVEMANKDTDKKYLNTLKKVDPKNNNQRAGLSEPERSNNNIRATIENRIKRLGNAENRSKEIGNIRKLIEQAEMDDQKAFTANLNNKISSLGNSKGGENAREELTNNNASRLQGILNSLKGAPSGSTNNIENKLKVLSENNKNFLREANENKLKDQLLKNAKLALAQKATAAVTDQG